MAHTAVAEVRSGTRRTEAGYERMRDLPKLLRLWPEEVRALTPSQQPWLVDRLNQVLRAERQRGLQRHWSYDLTRHAGVLKAYRAEKAALEEQVSKAARIAGMRRLALVAAQPSRGAD